jgi:hypothetical protein
MTPRIIDTKKLGLNNLGSMEIQCIATNSTASWVYLGRSGSLDRHYLNLIAYEMDTVTGKPIGEPIFLPDSTRKSDLGVVRIGKIIVDESKKLLYLCRVISPGLDDPNEFEVITVYQIDPSGRPIRIVKTCTKQFPGQANKGEGVYNIAIYQNHLYAVGDAINGVLIYELDALGIPITTTPTTFFSTTACQQVEIFNDKIYLGNASTLQVLDLDATGIPINASIKSFPMPSFVTTTYLEFQISNKGIYPQKNELLNLNRPLTRSLFFLPFDANGLPVLPVQTLPVDGMRGFGVNANDELWLATDDTYNDVLNASSGNKGIKLTKKDSIAPADNLSIKLKFTRLVCVAENGTPVLLCDSAGVVDFGNQSTIYNWHISFKVNKALPRLKSDKTFVLEGTPGKGGLVGIPTELGKWSEAISLDPFLQSTRQQIYDRSPTEIGFKTISLPPETTLGDFVEFWLPGYGVQDLTGEDSWEQRFAANLIEWASQRVQRYLTELQAISPAAVQPKQYSVSPYGTIGYQPSLLQLQTTAELLEYMGFNSSEISKDLWTGLDANQINTAVNSHLSYRNFGAGFPLNGNNIPAQLIDSPLFYFYFFLSEPTIAFPVLYLWVHKLSTELFKNGATSANIRTISIADEPKWEINDVVSKIRASAYYLKGFRDFLNDLNKTENPITPQDLGAPIADFKVLIPALVTLPAGTSLPDRKLYYWTVRFLVESASDAFGAISQLMRDYLAGVNQPNLFTPVNKSNMVELVNLIGSI